MCPRRLKFDWQFAAEGKVVFEPNGLDMYHQLNGLVTEAVVLVDLNSPRRLACRRRDMANLEEWR